MTKKPVLLCILDGWGEGNSPVNNAISGADTPNWDNLRATCPQTLLGTSGLDVGLPEGQMGNSEVGHMNIGSGRVIMQNLPKIDRAIEDETLANHDEIRNLTDKLSKSGKACHIMGLASNGGVHSHINHIIALARIVAGKGIKTYIHAFSDGRDTAPESALIFIKQIQDELKKLGDNASLATISGRYYAMDRDKRWERVSLAYDAIACADAPRESDAITAIQTSIDAGKSDEFIKPFVVGDYAGMEDGEALIMANFRADRARHLLEAFTLPDFNGFARKQTINFSEKIGIVKYSDLLEQHLTTLFSQELPAKTLGEIVAENGLKQLRIAETEKFAHITFFFNGGIENKFKNEDRELIPSPKVATYDLKPEMAAFEVTDKLVNAINSQKYALIVVNYANTDMVGHTGVYEAAIKAVEAVDSSLGRLVEAVNSTDGVMLVTADHGNAELMIDPKSGEPHTQHTLNKVPLIIMGLGNDSTELKQGKLCDIAPTILKIMNIKQPIEMTGECLVS